jgi:hypothetical protein
LGGGSAANGSSSAALSLRPVTSAPAEPEAAAEAAAEAEAEAAAAEAAAMAAQCWSAESSTTAQRPRPSTARTTAGSHRRGPPPPLQPSGPARGATPRTQTLTRSPTATKRTGRRAADGTREGGTREDGFGGQLAPPPPLLLQLEARSGDASTARRAFFEPLLLVLLLLVLVLLLPLLQDDENAGEGMGAGGVPAVTCRTVLP